MKFWRCWSDVAIADLNFMEATLASHWMALLDHARSVSGTQPSKKWVTRAENLLTTLTTDEFLMRVHRWLPLIGKRGTSEKTFYEHEIALIWPENADILKGIVWCCASIKTDDMARLVGNTAEQCFEKVKDFGPRCPKVGNACVAVLSLMNTKEAIAQISRLRSSSKSLSSKKQIEKELSKAAERSAMSVEDLQEISVSDFGFKDVGL
jgi:hypothetical protein